MSDATGTYFFAGVPAGTYFVEVTGPAGFLVTAFNQGGDDGLDSDVDPGFLITPTFSFGGGLFDDLDAGFVEVSLD